MMSIRPIWDRARDRLRLIPAWLMIGWIVAAGLIPPASGALQFDVFIGFDGLIHEANWFPITCEVFNDGPSFQGTVELSSGQFGGGQTRRVALELPTNTRKRLTLPVFAGSARFGSWDVRLLDERGKVRAEKIGQRPQDVAWETLLVGAVPRTFGGLPSFAKIKLRRSELQPQVGRIHTDHFPDHPIVLEGLDAAYINSERALELRANQVAALLAWIHQGGHAIFAIEQPSHVNGTPWLRQLLPCDLNDVANRSIQGAFHEWLRSGPDLPLSRYKSPAVEQLRYQQSPLVNLPADPLFDQAEIPVALGSIKEGQVLLALQGTPAVIHVQRGRGQVTVLTFSPEREPFRSWKGREWFWAKLLNVPKIWYAAQDYHYYNAMSIDGVFGALIDTQQVRKLPVKWLLLLLVVYLGVIGPFDQYWLKRLRKQMWTWVTFPIYVAFFSILIYYIGYKLRAGESEWNELHLVDVLLRGERAELRGRTYASIYSPANAKYRLTNEQFYATLRSEFQGLWSGGQDSSKALIDQRANGYGAEIFVPVWTSQLYVSDWLQPSDVPLTAKITPEKSGYRLEVENRMDRDLLEGRLVIQERVYELGRLPSRQIKKFLLERNQGIQLQQFVQRHAQGFFGAVMQRQRALGDDRVGRLTNLPLSSMAASFVSQLNPSAHGNQRFVFPNGLDLSPLVERGSPILMAWDADHSPIQPINRFQPARSQRNTLLRLTLAMEPAGGLLRMP